MYTKSRWTFLKEENGQATIDGVPVSELIKEYGSPLFVLAEDEIRRRVRSFRNAFPYKKLQMQYATKPNSNPEVLRIVREEGGYLDVSSVGELMLGLIADFKPSQMTLTTMHKSEKDLNFAIRIGINAITIDAVEEIDEIARVAEQLGKKARVFLRVNPQLRLGTYSTINHKYGVPIKFAKEAIDLILSKQSLELVGLHFHGAYISNPEVYELAAAKLVPLAVYAQQRGAKIEFIDLGGGFPVKHDDTRAFTPESMGKRFVDRFVKLCKKHGLSEPTLVFEPGKYLVANAGVALVTVVSVKDLGNKKIAIVDGSAYTMMPDVMLAYNWYYEVVPVTKMRSEPMDVYSVGGATCDNIDMMAHDRKLPALFKGDLLAFMDTGAYTGVIASNFNALKRPPVAMVKQGKHRLIRRRDRYGEMFAQELDVLKIAEPNELKDLVTQARAALKKL